MDETRCKKEVWEKSIWPRSHQCQRKAVRDGYCIQHHPEAAKEREIKSRERYEEKFKNSDFYRLKKLTERMQAVQAAAENILFKWEKSATITDADIRWLREAIK